MVEPAAALQRGARWSRALGSVAEVGGDRGIDQELWIALVELAGQGIHDPDTMPFGIAWTDEPAP